MVKFAIISNLLCLCFHSKFLSITPHVVQLNFKVVNTQVEFALLPAAFMPSAETLVFEVPCCLLI